MNRGVIHNSNIAFGNLTKVKIGEMKLNSGIICYNVNDYRTGVKNRWHKIERSIMHKHSNMNKRIRQHIDRQEWPSLMILQWNLTLAGGESSYAPIVMLASGWQRKLCTNYVAILAKHVMLDCCFLNHCPSHYVIYYDTMCLTNKISDFQFLSSRSFEPIYGITTVLFRWLPPLELSNRVHLVVDHP